MKTKKDFLKELLVAGLMVIAAFSLLVFQNKGKVLAGSPFAYQQASTATNITVGLAATGSSVASSTQILASNNSRVFARCYNDNLNGVIVSFMLGSTATSSSEFSGIIISSTASTSPSYFQIDQTNPFTGAIYAYSQATSTVNCVEN